MLPRDFSNWIPITRFKYSVIHSICMVKAYTYKCTSCKFSIDKDRPYEGKCPYCGNAKLKLDKKNQAERLLKDADNWS